MQRTLSQNEATDTGHSTGLPDSLAGRALFLDVDGVLIDIAPRPELVVVPPHLPGDLIRAAAIADGALALVSGRTIGTLDELLRPARLPAAGLHGGEFRGPDGESITVPPPPALAVLRPQLTALAQRLPGLQIEDKGRAIAVHYRAVPEAGGEVDREVEAMAAGSEGTLAAQKGKMVIELKPSGAGKGLAVGRFMEMPPFLDREPIAIGDDITDEEMFRIVNELGGQTFRVGAPDRPTDAKHYVDSPEAVRKWLASIE